LDVATTGNTSDSTVNFNALRLYNDNFYFNDTTEILFKHGNNAGQGQAKIQTFLPGGNDVDMRFYTTNSASLNTIPNLTLTGDGNVGIGTANPASKLHLFGTNAASLISRSESNASGYAVYDQYYNSGSSKTGYCGIDGTGLFGQSTGALALGTNDTPIIFSPYYSTGEKMRIDTSGNVGIGTTNPEYALDVNGLASSKTSRVFEFSGSDNYARHFWICSFLDAPGYHTNQLIKINYSVTYKRLTDFHSRNSLASGTVTFSDLWRYTTSATSGEFQYVTLQDQKNEQYGGQGALPKWYYVRFNNIGYLVLSVSVKGDSSSYYVKGNVDFLTRPSAESADRIFNGTVYKDSNIQQTEGFTSLSDLYPTTGTGVDGWDTTMTSESTAQNFIEATEGTVFKYGNVGIGTVSPGNKLHIYGTDNQLFEIQNTNDTARMVLNGASGTGGDLIFKQNGTSTWGIASIGDKLHFLGDDSSSQYRMTLDNSGNVGIGTASPTARLTLWCDHSTPSDGSSTAAAKPEIGLVWRNRLVTSAGGSPNPDWYSGTTRDSASIWYHPRSYSSVSSGALGVHGSINFNCNYTGTEATRMVITSIGRVGIGNTTPSYTLDVNGNLRCFGFTNSSDDRIKYNEQNVSNALTLISQLKPQKYEKIMERPNPSEGTWIPTDDEWENVKENYKYGDEFGFIAQDVREVPELAFLVNGEETRTDTKTSTLEEYSNLTTEEQSTYTISYLHESNVITQEEYSNLTPEEQEASVAQYTKEIEIQTPLSLNYNGLFVLAIGAIQELKAKNDALEARLDALESA